MGALMRGLMGVGIACLVYVGAIVPVHGESDTPAVTVEKKSGRGIDVTPGTRVALKCKTSAIGMDFDPFKTSEGSLEIEIAFSGDAPTSAGDTPADANGSPKPNSGSSSVAPLPIDEIGSWRGSANTEKHGASFGIIIAKLCEPGCTVRSTPSDNLELWAPKPVMPSKLGEKDTLTLATLDVKTLEIKATTFRNKQLSILEKGTCEVVKP